MHPTDKTAVIPFAFDDALVRAVWVEDDPWFVLSDVCKVLGIGNPSDAARRLDEDEKHTLDNNEGIAAPQVQSLIIISESGLYALIMTSRKPQAKRFRKWVTAEVIPSLRKTGRYALPGAEDMNPAERPDITALVNLLRECRTIWGKPAARDLWRKLRLPEVDVPAPVAPFSASFEMDAQDGISAFLAACTIAAPKSTINASVLFNAYLAWCALNERRPASQSMFGKLLVLMGIPRRKRGVMYYDGLALRTGEV